MPHRELVVIRTHDSLITPLRSSRNIAEGVGAAGGGLVSSDCGDRVEVEMHDGTQRRNKRTRCALLVWRVVSVVCLLGGPDQSRCATVAQASAGFQHSR